MIVSLRHLLGWMVSAFRSREDLVLENLALRRQLLALHAQRPLWFAKILCMHRINSLAAKRLWIIRHDSGHGSAAPLLSRLANRHGTGPTRHLSWRTGMKSKQLLAKCEATHAQHPRWVRNSSGSGTSCISPVSITLKCSPFGSVYARYPYLVGE